MCNSLITLPLISAAISSITSQTGISGAFLLLPVQLSLLGIESPVASSTNLLYNVVSTPGGIYRHWKENRLNPRLSAIILLGTIPGMLTGAWIRACFLPSPETFRVFAGAVLLLISLRLILSGICGKSRIPEKFEVSGANVSGMIYSYEFDGKVYRVKLIHIVPVAYAIGTVAGAYGVGGGAFLVPLLVSVFSLPVYTISGAVLLSTFVTSVLSSLFYAFLGYPPDILLGLLFGIGGVFGTYFGAGIQKMLPERAIKTMLGLIVGIIALKYITAI